MSEEDNLQDTNAASPATALGQLISGSEGIQLVYVAAKLGIADLLKDGPRGSDELAKSVGAHPRTLYRVLRALATLGVFAENNNGTFELTPLSELLQTGVPESLRSAAIMNGEEWIWRPWGELIHSVRTGKPAFDHIFGMPAFEYLAKNPEAGNTFAEIMTDATMWEGPSILDAYDFSGITTIVDVGGGHGSLIAAILKAYPQMSGILADMPFLIEGAKGLIESEGIADRCELVALDFFESVPHGGDAYILKRIIHDWEDEKAITILKNCHRAMADDARLLLVEQVIPAGNEPHPGKVADIFMLLFGGVKRTGEEYEALLNAAGFELANIHPTESEMSVIEGVPA